MSNRRTYRLDELEHRLTGPKRIALFGHRAVGKTTLLAMFYREAAHGRVPGVRLAAADPASAEYLAEKIAQIEAGEPPAGTLAETALRLRLYHNRARFDLVVKDYQGEHVTLGTEAPIQAFFADCDAVLLCLDPETTDKPIDRRRRQQEVEGLLERYIERSDEATTERPVALLVTKYDRVLDGEGMAPEQVEHLVEARYGMTRHALARHARRSAIFAVSSYGPGAGRDGRPPVELHPLGLEGPLGWLADELEAVDRETLEWLWDLAPDDLPRLSRCVHAYRRRYPHSDHAEDFNRRLATLRRRHVRRGLVRLTAVAATAVAALAGYDAWGYRAASAFERGGNPPLAVERRWSDLLAWHPSLPVFWPASARDARLRYDRWRLKADEARVAAGTAGPGVDAELKRLKAEEPTLAPAIQRVEEAQDRRRHDEAWRVVRVADLAAIERPEEHLAAARKFLRDFPATAHRAEAVGLIDSLVAVVDRRRDEADRHAVEALTQAGSLPDADLEGLIRQAREFLDGHPESRRRPEAQTLLADYAARLDDRDFARAEQFSRESPTNYNVRARKYHDYLRAHQGGGRHVGEATAALERIERERDLHLYRQAYDYAIAHPDDVAAVARDLRAYLDANPSGRFVAAAREYLAWWEKISVPNDYHVVLLRGEVESDVGKMLSGGAPDLGVEITVAGVRHGPSPVVPNSHQPKWNYRFPRAVKWKYGDPVTIRILDFDWSSSGTGVFRLNSPKGDRLAMRMLSGTVRPTHGGRTSLVFASDFKVPTLPRPE
jgi:GTPase SAR1 family protein